MKRLVVRTFFALFIYTNSAWLVGKMANATAYLLARDGASDLWDVFHMHPFARSIGVGILAGLIPFHLWLTLSGFIRADIPEFLRKLELDKMKPWIVLLCSPVLVVVIGGWLSDWIAMHSKTVTVLGDSSTMPVWRMFEGFFSTNCQNVSDNRLDLWTDNFALQCNTHVLLISAFLTAAGYSIAPSLRSRIPRETCVEDPTINETAHQELEPTNSVNTNEQAP